jgi:hypothetical protein
VLENKDKINPIFATNIDKPDLFKAWDSDIGRFKTNDATNLFEPSGFAKEIRYLRERGINQVKFKDGTILNLDTVDLDNIKLDWETNWNH